MTNQMTKITRKIFFLLLLACTQFISAQGFNASPLQWNVPGLGNDEYKVYDSDHSVIDFNGDGKPDLVDSSDGGNVFVNGSQKYWKVYLNTGSAFSQTATQWNIPNLGNDEYIIYDSDHGVYDFNGDDKPDLVDSSDGGSVFMNGGQRYWKVYLNTGSGFSATFVQWNLPAIGPDDYKIASTTHNVIDFNGDNKPDLIDSSDNGNVFTTGSQKYWKVYLNTGSGFSATFIQWNIPVIGSDDYKASDTTHNVIDFNGDNKPDLIDSSDNGNVFMTAGQRFWKVYINSGSGFGQAAVQWNIPNLESYDYAIYHTSHSVLDFNNDNKPDLVDSGDGGNVFLNGSQKFWKVYLNNGSSLSTVDPARSALLTVYPNPVRGMLNLLAQDHISSISICNAQGQRVMAVAVNDSSSAVDVSHLPAGVYFARVTALDNAVSVQRFVKE